MNSLERIFERYFSSLPERVVHAPERVNLIGDHTDYNGGFVLPAAINMGTDVAIKPRGDSKVQIASANQSGGLVEFDLNQLDFDNQATWTNYVRGTLKALQTQFSNINGADLLVRGNLPIGAGLSSSASLEIALLRAFAESYQLPLTGVAAAKLGQHAENHFVGCNCGIMDQLISALGKVGHAMLLDCNDLSFEDVEIDEGLAVLIINSNVKRGLVDSEYNQRREQCERVAAYFEQPSLRGVSLEQLSIARDQLSELEYKRAYHVLTENQRTVDAALALKNNDLPQLSKLMAESHLSLARDFCVSTPEIDNLVSLVDQVVAGEGGARMTGGGFGGCVVAIMPKVAAKEVINIIEQQYPILTGLTADIYMCNAAQGAFREQ